MKKVIFYIAVIVFLGFTTQCFAVDNPLYIGADGLGVCPPGETLSVSLCYAPVPGDVPVQPPKTSIVKPTVSPKKSVISSVNPVPTESEISNLQDQITIQNKIGIDEEKQIGIVHSLVTRVTELVIGIVVFLALEIVLCCTLILRIIRGNQE